MMRAVVGRALGAGALAGALSGAVAVIVFVVASAVHPGSGGLRVGELAGATINYLLLAVLIGAAAGAALAIPVGVILGLGHRQLTRQPARARIAAALLCAAVVVAFGAALSALGTATMYLGLLVVPALIVTPAVGAWRAMRIVDGPVRSEPAEPGTALPAPALGTEPPQLGHQRGPAPTNPAPTSAAPSASDTVLVAAKPEKSRSPDPPTTATRRRRVGAPPVIPDSARRRAAEPGSAAPPAGAAQPGPPVESGTATARPGRRRSPGRGAAESARHAAGPDDGPIPLQAGPAPPGTDPGQGAGGRRHRAPDPAPPIGTTPDVERPATGRRRHAAAEPDSHDLLGQRRSSTVDPAPAAEPTDGRRHRAEEPASPPNGVPLLRRPTSRHAAAPPEGQADDPRNGARHNGNTSNGNTSNGSTSEGHRRRPSDDDPIPIVPAQRRHGPEGSPAPRSTDPRGEDADPPRRHRRRDDQAG